MISVISSRLYYESNKGNKNYLNQNDILTVREEKTGGSVLIKEKRRGYFRGRKDGEHKLPIKPTVSNL
jgi:hypothetical protein